MMYRRHTTACLTIVALAALLAALGCESSEPPASSASAESTATEGTEAQATAEEGAPEEEVEAEAEHADGPAPIRENADGSRLYGSEIDEARDTTALAAMMESPAEFNGQTVKTEGVISQVCQRMGCWMELRPEGDEGSAVRVPMAGHSFFLPRDVAGRQATVEGTVEVRELDEGTQEHLREEGAEAADQSLSIVATAVLVH